MLQKVFPLCSLFLLVNQSVSSQDSDFWPKEIEVASGVIVIYQPQPESLQGNKLSSRAAVSFTPEGGDPTFGAIWTEATVNTDRDSRLVTIENIKVTNAKFPEAEQQENIEKFKTLLETEVPKWDLAISLDQLNASLEMVAQEQQLSADLQNTPPRILFEEQPSLLILVDGEPKIQKDPDLGVDRVVNTPYPIFRHTDGKFYLFLSPRWLSASSVTGDWAVTTSPPKKIKSLEKSLTESDASSPEQTADKGTPKILVSTEPAELIQSDGKPDFKPIEGTNLLFMANSDDDIFMDINTQHYFILLSGRWYQAQQLDGTWSYIASDKLPEDFRKIPKGSEKDNVLASVAGTDAARDAVADAMVPQTAKVDRKNATTTVTYDGDPKFEDIPGTKLQHAVNTQSTVLKEGSNYYVVDNGVWFTASNPKGPWTVATERPDDVEKIPPDNPTYNVKYVYIYESTPEYVYVGYTPGYVGCYVYGPTVVYGTGYYYNPWYGPYYYPRPCTWGFSMHYNPWTGWSMGIGFSSGGFSMMFGFGGGWWGPPVYYPPYRPPYNRYYGGRPVVVHNDININNINIDRSNNIYNNRKDVTTRDVQRGDRPGMADRSAAQPSRPQTRDAAAAPNRDRQRPANNVQTDRNGNLYQQNQGTGEWSQRQDRDWKPVNPEQNSRDYSQLNQVQQSRNRGQMNSSGYRQSVPQSRPAMRGGGMRRR